MAEGYPGSSLRTRPLQSTKLFLMAVRPPAVLLQAGGWGRWAAGVAVSWLIPTFMRRQCHLCDGSAKEFSYNLGNPGLGVPSKSGWAFNTLRPGEPRSAGDRSRRPEQARAPPAPASSSQTAPGFRVPPDAGPPQPGVCSKVGSPRGERGAPRGHLSRVPAPQPRREHAAGKWERAQHSSSLRHLWGRILGVPGEGSLGGSRQRQEAKRGGGCPMLI